MSNATPSPVDDAEIFMATSALLLVAGLLSVGISTFSGEWPAGHGGLGAALFVATGIVLAGYSYLGNS